LRKKTSYQGQKPLIRQLDLSNFFFLDFLLLIFDLFFFLLCVVVLLTLFGVELPYQVPSV
jgi:hypothetical protein